MVRGLEISGEMVPRALERITRVVRVRDGRLWCGREIKRRKEKKKTRASTIEEPERRVNEKKSGGTERCGTERIRAT